MSRALVVGLVGVGLVGVGLGLSGCSTVTRGLDNDVAFISTPPGASMTTDTGLSCTTPCRLEIRRNQEFSATFNLEGFEAQTVPVGTRVATAGAAGFAGNLLAGGIVGMAVDASTGATLEHYPNPVTVTFGTAETETLDAAPETPAPLSAPTDDGVPVS